MLIAQFIRNFCHQCSLLFFQLLLKKYKKNIVAVYNVLGIEEKFFLYFSFLLDKWHLPYCGLNKIFLNIKKKIS
jgi:hypothetical protein